MLYLCGFWRFANAYYIVYGEGEIPCLNLLRFVVDHIGERSAIKSIKYLDEAGQYIETELEDLIMELDKLPFPDKENSLNKRFRSTDMIGILTGRGCPYHCSFCFEGAASKVVRLRSIKNVVSEIENVRRNNPNLRIVNVYDDTFTLNRSRVMAFCEYMKASGLKWTCEGHVSRIYADTDLVQIMVDSGLYAMQIGIESGSQKVLDAYQKNITPEEIIEVVRICKEAGLTTLEGNYIVGGALECADTIQESMEHAKKLIEVGRGMIDISTVFFAPYANTPISRNPSDYNMNIDTYQNAHTIVTMTEAVVSTKHLTLAEIVSWKRKFDEEIRQAYSLEIPKFRKDDLLRRWDPERKKLDLNNSWCTALNGYLHIKEFIKHLGNGEQEYSENKYPVRTICNCRHQNMEIEFNGIVLRGEEREYIMLADGKRNIKEISVLKGETIEYVKSVYDILNDRCFIYFSDF